MNNSQKNRKTNTDNFLYHKLLAAMELPEGTLSIEIVKSYFGFTNQSQAEGYLKNQDQLLYQIAFVEQVIPKFTKQDIINQLKKEFFEMRDKYVFLEAIEPEWFM